MVNITPRPLHPREGTAVAIHWEAECAPESVCRLWMPGYTSVLAFAGIDRASFSGMKRRGRTFVVLPLGIPSFCQRYCSTYESKKKHCASENRSSSIFRFVSNFVLFLHTDAMSYDSHLEH